MADGEKLNVDSIIGRLLEGWFPRFSVVQLRTLFRPKICRILKVSLAFQFEVQDQERMFNLQRQKFEGCV